jgi:hypothetical protein
MRPNKILLRLPINLTLLPLILSIGCSHPQSPEATQAAARAGQAAVLNQQMKDIDDNPNMPPEAKAAAKAALERGQSVDMGTGKK